MRIVGGKMAGRHLTSPGGRVRPTAEAVRDGWLALLERDLPGTRVVDLFAGTGALGLEALSRGARYADFVEDSPSSLHALKANVAALRVKDRTRIFKRDALRWAAALPERKYDIAFADPPYGSVVLDRLIEGWLERPFSNILTVEHDAEHRLPRGGRLHRFEATSVTIYRAPPVKAAADEPEETGGDR